MSQAVLNVVMAVVGSLRHRPPPGKRNHSGLVSPKTLYVTVRVLKQCVQPSLVRPDGEIS